MQLLYPRFLVALLATIIPIIIHLLLLKRPLRQLFTNIAFIQEVELVAMRHRQVRRWLLLIARVLAIAALVLMFCQPFIPAKHDGSRTAVSGLDILVDNTFSMQSPKAAQGDLFDEAVVAAGSLAKTLPAGGRLRLINDGDELLTPTAYQTKLSNLTLSAQTLISKINGIGLKQGGEQRHLYFFSDFQKGNFSTHFLDGLNPNQQVLLVPLMGRPTANVYVDSVWVDDAFIRVHANVGVHVRVRNGGSAAANNCPVKVFLGAQQVAAFRVTVEAGQTTTLVVQIQVSNGALVLGRVVTEDMAVAFDNTYYFTLQPAAVIKVLEIGAEPVAQRLYANEPVFEYSFAKTRNVNYGVLRQADMVLMQEVEDVDAGLREGLRAVVKRGGSVVIVPSARATGHDAYQRLFKELGLGAVQWETASDAPERRAVAMPNAKEPFFRDVFGAQQRTATMPRVAPVLRWSRTGADILRLEDGNSYLASFASGAGRVYVFSAPFAEGYSNFVSHPLFVPVLYRIAMLSYHAEQLPAYRLNRGTVALTVPAGPDAAGGQADDAGFRLVKDSVTLIPGQRLLGQEVRLDLPAGMDAAGFYQVQRRGKVMTTLAFNQDKQESELAAYSADELRKMIGPNRPNIRVLEGGTDGGKLATFRGEQTGQPLWRYFLAVALACLLAEAMLVRFGGRRGNIAMSRPVG